MGPCAVVENEQAVVLLTSRKMPPMDLGQVHSQGVRPEEAAFGTKFFHHMALVLVQDLFGKNVEVAEGPQELQPFRE